MGQAAVRVYGLDPSKLRQLSALNSAIMYQRNNKIIITAGDDVSGMGRIFEGQIAVGQIDMNGSPDSALVLSAFAGLLNAVQPAPPSSYPGTADVAVIMQNLATAMGYTFENNGISVILSTPYLPGTLRDQAMRCANAANINWVIDNGTLAIWPRFGSRGGSVPLITPESGMVGYPTYSEMGIALKTIFNPFLILGQTVEVRSSLNFANGRWNIFNLEHDLESETPGGDWFTRFTGNPYSNAAAATAPAAPN